MPDGFPAAHDVLVDRAASTTSKDACGPRPKTGHFTIDAAEWFADHAEDAIGNAAGAVVNYAVHHPKAAAAEAVALVGLAGATIALAPQVAIWTGIGLLATHVAAVGAIVYFGFGRAIVGKEKEETDWYNCKSAASAPAN